MPLGTAIGELTAKITSVRIVDLGGGQTRIEFDSTGATTGQVPGQAFGTTVVDLGPGQTGTWSGTGVILAKSGAVVRTTSRGVSIRTGEGHKVRYRGSVCFTTDDATLAALNGVLAAVEFEVDPATMSAAGTAYEWK